jgi:hypothetical protein
MRRGVVLSLVLALAASLAACGSSRSGKVDDYVKAANAIQSRAAPEFARANAAYKRFSANKLAKQAPVDLERAEAAIRGTREELAKLAPPSEARRLHSLLLRLFDLNIALAHETTQMAVYLPAASAATKPLAKINERLQRGLGAGGSVPQQTQTLGRYRGELRKVVVSLRQLDPPPVLAGVHSDQLSRLEATRTLAAQLRAALKAADQRRVSDLLVRFRSLNTEAGGDIAERSLVAYQERQQDVARAAQAVQREQNRLSATLR